MKKIGSILCLTALIVTMTASVCFGAESLEIVDKYPNDGQKNTTIENMCVKLTMSNDMGNKASRKANADCFSLTDDKGKKVPIRVFYDPDDSKKMMVLADTVKIAENKLRIKDNTEYTLHVSGNLTDNDGNTLGSDETISFTTLNQARNTQVYMVMMFIMFGGMFFFSSRQMKKQTEKQKAESGKEEPFNPYKEAKKSGKSVEEVIAAHEKEMEKKAAKAARKAVHNKDDDDDDDDYEDEDNGNYKVKGPRPISAGGSTYITGRKALAEARKAEEERLAKRRANAKKKKKK